MTTGPTFYATDEDIALRASADFVLLCPKDQKLASGLDGLFTPYDRWGMTSPSVNFEVFGVRPGNVLTLAGPIGAYKPPGETFAVEVVSGNTVVLRRKGQRQGLGQPAGPMGGLEGVEFFSATLAPQIARASYDLNRRFGIDDLIAGRRPCDLFDPREVMEATVLTVLHRQYLEMSRGQEGKGDTFAAKAQLYKQELDDLLARTVVHWAPALGDASGGMATTRFGTRLSR